MSRNVVGHIAIMSAESEHCTTIEALALYIAFLFVLEFSSLRSRVTTSITALFVEHRNIATLQENIGKLRSNCRLISPRSMVASLLPVKTRAERQHRNSWVA